MHSMERLYNQLVKSGQPALEPLMITNSGSKLFWRVAFIWWKLEIQCNLTVVIIEPSLNCDNFGQTVRCFGLFIVIRALEETDYESQQNWKAKTTVLQHIALCWESPDLALWLNPYISQLIQHGWCALISIVQGQG